MNKKWWYSLVTVGIGGMILAASTAFASGDVYLPGGSDKTLPYKNDASEEVYFRGQEQYTIIGGRPLQIPTSLLKDDKGTYYYTTSDSISAVSSRGRSLWSYSLPTPGGVKRAILGADGTIYVYEEAYSYYDTKGVVFAFAPDGTLKWVYEMKEFSAIGYSGHAGDSQGNFILQTDQGIMSIGSGGVVNWTNTDILRKEQLTSSFVSTNISNILADKQGNIIIQTQQEGIYVLDSGGKLKWKKLVDGMVYLGGDQIYILSESGVRTFVTSTGQEKEVVPDQIPLDSALPNDHEGGYYITGENGIAKIDATGGTLWTYEIREMGYRSAYGLSSDVDGNVTFTNNGGSVYSLDKLGHERFVVYIQNHSSNGSDIVSDSRGTVTFLSDAMGFSQVLPKTKRIRVHLDDREVFFPVEPKVNNGTTLLPMRKVFEMLGSSVTWDPATKTATARKQGTTISITIDSKTASINGKEVALEEAPVIVNGNTLVPLRFVGEALGYKVGWDGNDRRIDLDSPSKGSGTDKQAEAKYGMVLTNSMNRYWLIVNEDWYAGFTKAGQFQATDKADRYMTIDTHLKADMNDNINKYGVRDIIMNNVREAASNPVFSSSKDVTIGGLQGVQFDASGIVDNIKIHYLITVLEEDDRYHILVQWTIESKFADSLATFKEFADSFRGMDKKQAQ